MALRQCEWIWQHCYGITNKWYSNVINEYFIFLVDFEIELHHFAYGFPDQGIKPEDKTADRDRTGPLEWIHPFLGETVLLSCHSTVYQEPTICSYINATSMLSSNFTFNRFVVELEHTCGVANNICGIGLRWESDIHIYGELLIILLMSLCVQSVLSNSPPP